MEATALHDFNTTDKDELPFKKGEVVKVLNMDEDKNWYKAELKGKEGFVPKNYIQLKPHPWFYGKIRRAEAEKMLLAECKDGDFIVRDSESTPGDFSLSVMFSNQVQHFKVLRDGAGKYFLWVVKFTSLNELLNYHKTSSVSRSQRICLEDPTKVDRKELCEALFDFNAEDAGELSFKASETIVILKKENADWYLGAIGCDRRGLFPATYVGPHPSAANQNK